MPERRQSREELTWNVTDISRPKKSVCGGGGGGEQGQNSGVKKIRLLFKNQNESSFSLKQLQPS